MYGNLKLLLTLSKVNYSEVPFMVTVICVALRTGPL